MVSYSLRFTIVQSVLRAFGKRLAKTPDCKVDECGSQSRLFRFSANVRSIRVMRRMASASCGVVPYQNPQRFSSEAYPCPLKKACWRQFVLSRVKRSVTFTMCRDSSHLLLLTIGTKGYSLPSQVTQSFQPMLAQASDSSRTSNCGSRARG